LRRGRPLAVSPADSLRTNGRWASDTIGGVSELLLRRVRPWPREPGGASVDVLVRGGHIAAIGTGLAVGPDIPSVDGGDGVLLPALTDAHAHLDSTRLGLPFRPHSAQPGLAGLIMNDRANWRSAGGSVADRATYTLGATIASGTTTVRSHAQVDSDCGLERLHGVLRAREAHAGRARVQVVAFPQSGIVHDPGTADLLDAAIRDGADLVGGLDPCGYDRDPVAHLDVVFGVAERHGVGVDIHLHEAGELGAFTFELIAERTAALGMRGQVTISHAFALSTVEPARQAALVELLAEHDIALATVAPGNREPLPLEALRAAGVRVGLGQDGIRDYWSPYGNGDVLERAWQLAFRSSYRRDDLVEECVDVASRGGRSIVEGTSWSACPVGDDEAHGLAVGAVADLVVVAADTVTAAVMDHPPRTVVVRGGRIVARAGTLTSASTTGDP
jgi:cytosine/adenosine deaminase-related metal-dependent hydrolase